jgi:DNA polymerase I-like protein with 3'-5' exonuclease and polymerase domains
MSESDGFIHLGLKTCGTKTGRFAGTGGLNQQGLSRKSKPLMRCFVAREGYIFVSSDGAAMEPTVTSEYTRDKNYKYCTYDGIGKDPYYEDDVLYIDDIYLMVLTILPFGRDLMREMFAKTYDGKTFAQQWAEDRSVIINEIKKQRTLAKIIVLGLSYGLQSKNLRKTLAEAGTTVPMKVAEEIFTQYWKLFSGIKGFANRLRNEVEVYGYLINPFGFRMRPDPYKSFNALIQSSVNGVIYLYLKAVTEVAPYAEFVTIIHDEILFQIPVDKQDDFREKISKATDQVNNELGWTVPMRFGCAFGETLYEAK